MTDIAELFARDPQQLTRPDIEQIVAEFRQRRHLFKTSGVTPKKTPATRSLSDSLKESLSDTTF